MKTENDKTKTSQTLARGLEVLHCFLSIGRVEDKYQMAELGIKELTQQLGLPQTVVARLVATLAAYGYLQQNRVTKKYFLGVSAFILGQASGMQTNLRQVAQPWMEQLAEYTGETISCTIVDPITFEGVCIASIDSLNEIKLTTKVGSVRPLHRGATRKVLLAFLEPWQQEKYLSKLTMTKWDRQQLVQELEQIRMQHYAYSAEELDPGAFAIAAPIIAPSGSLLGSIAVAGPLFRKPDELMVEWTQWVKDAASGVEDTLQIKRI
jgi:DNA-binding IclR family transcriptional regulator